MNKEYVKYMQSRFGNQKMNDEEKEAYLSMMVGPEQYENEDMALKLAKDHPEASIVDLMWLWEDATPDGLPPCAKDWDDYEEMLELFACSGMDPNELDLDDDEDDEDETPGE